MHFFILTKTGGSLCSECLCITTAFQFHKQYCHANRYSLLRFQEAIDKYESSMKTEPNVPFYTTKAKERICHCLVQVCEPTSTKHVSHHTLPAHNHTLATLSYVELFKQMINFQAVK